SRAAVPCSPTRCSGTRRPPLAGAPRSRSTRTTWSRANASERLRREPALSARAYHRALADTWKVCSLGQPRPRNDMAESIVHLYEAKPTLSRLVERAAGGEEIIIAKAGKPLAKLVSAAKRSRRRKPGGWKGRMRIEKDFDAPLPAALRAGFDGRR